MAGSRAWIACTPLIVTLALAAAALVAPAPAAAVLSYVASGNVSTDEGNQGTSTVSCPASSFGVGGGAFSTGDFMAVAIASSAPTGNASWREFTDVYEGTQLHRTFAICDSTEPELEFASKTVPAGSEKTIRAECAPGEHVYGGGFFPSLNFGTTFTRSSRPYVGPEDGWKATVFSNSGDHQVTVYAFCGFLNSSLRTKTVDLAKKSQGSAQKRCASGDQVTGGGAGIAVGDGRGWISSIFPVDTDTDATPDDAWRAYLENTSSKEREITVYSICR